MKFVKRTDFIIISIILIISIFLIFSYKYFIPKDNTYAEIYYKSELIEKIRLDGSEKIFILPENKKFKIQTYSDNSIAVTESDCPNRICIRTGKISYPGESAACLPNNVIIKIVSENNDLDEIAG